MATRVHAFFRADTNQDLTLSVIEQIAFRNMIGEPWPAHAPAEFSMADALIPTATPDTAALYQQPAIRLFLQHGDRASRFLYTQAVAEAENTGTCNTGTHHFCHKSDVSPYYSPLPAQIVSSFDTLTNIQHHLGADFLTAETRAFDAVRDWSPPHLATYVRTLVDFDATLHTLGVSERARVNVLGATMCFSPEARVEFLANFFANVQLLQHVQRADHIRAQLEGTPLPDTDTCKMSIEGIPLMTRWSAENVATAQAVAAPPEIKPALVAACLKASTHCASIPVLERFLRSALPQSAERWQSVLESVAAKLPILDTPTLQRTDRLLRRFRFYPDVRVKMLKLMLQGGGDLSAMTDDLHRLTQHQRTRGMSAQQFGAALYTSSTEPLALFARARDAIDTLDHLVGILDHDFAFLSPAAYRRAFAVGVRHALHHNLAGMEEMLADWTTPELRTSWVQRFGEDAVFNVALFLNQQHNQAAFPVDQSPEPLLAICDDFRRDSQVRNFERYTVENHAALQTRDPQLPQVLMVVADADWNGAMASVADAIDRYVAQGKQVSLIEVKNPKELFRYDAPWKPFVAIEVQAHGSPAVIELGDGPKGWLTPREIPAFQHWVTSLLDASGAVLLNCCSTDATPQSVARQLDADTPWSVQGLTCIGSGAVEWLGARPYLNQTCSPNEE